MPERGAGAGCRSGANESEALYLAKYEPVWNLTNPSHAIGPKRCHFGPKTGD